MCLVYYDKNLITLIVWDIEAMIKIVALIWNFFVFVLTFYVIHQYGFPDVNDEKVVFFWVLAILGLTVINIIAIKKLKNIKLD